MTTREVAELFSVDPKTVQEWARKGLLTAKRTPGGRDYRFDRREVMGKHSSNEESKRTHTHIAKHGEKGRVVEDRQGFRVDDADRERRGVGNQQTGGRDD